MQRTGGELVQDFLATLEIPYVFGNPGTTETTFLAAVAASKASYVLALHESSAVGIAAGYALMTGKPAVVSLHTYPGLANGMGTTLRATQFVGLDFDDPDVDVLKVAEGLGAQCQRIASLESIGEVLTQALAYAGPSFIVIDREP